MEVTVAIIEAFGNVIGSVAWVWAVVNVTGIISKTILVAGYDIEPERLKDWVGLEIKRKKKSSL
jgi:hypothetical protein